MTVYTLIDGATQRTPIPILGQLTQVTSGALPTRQKYRMTLHRTSQAAPGEKIFATVAVVAAPGNTLVHGSPDPQNPVIVASLGNNDGLLSETTIESSAPYPYFAAYVQNISPNHKASVSLTLEC